MKGLVLEIRDGFAAVLLEDGTVERVRRSCRVGQTIELDAREKAAPPPRRGLRWAAAAAAALVLVSAGGVYGYNNAYAYSYVTLDANPSIEYVLNRRNRLLSVSPLNDDAQDIVDGLNAENLRQATISDAIDRTRELLYVEDYLGEDKDNCLLINVSSRGEEQLAELTEELSGYFDERDDGALTVYMTSATREEARRAEALGVSAGRYKLIEDIVGGEGLSESELRRFDGAPVGELIDRSGLPEREDVLFAQNAPDPGAQAAPGDDALQPVPEPSGAPQEGYGQPGMPGYGQERTDAPQGEPEQPQGDGPEQSQPQGDMPQDGPDMSASGEPS